MIYPLGKALNFEVHEAVSLEYVNPTPLGHAPGAG